MTVAEGSEIGPDLLLAGCEPVRGRSGRAPSARRPGARAVARQPVREVVVKVGITTWIPASRARGTCPPPREELEVGDMQGAELCAASLAEPVAGRCEAS
jgi:hypothetical protein